MTNEDKVINGVILQKLASLLLNNASAITRFEAVCGRLIFSREASRRAEFVSLAAREYEDEMALLMSGLKIRLRS